MGRYRLIQLGLTGSFLKSWAGKRLRGFDYCELSTHSIVILFSSFDLACRLPCWNFPPLTVTSDQRLLDTLYTQSLLDAVVSEAGIPAYRYSVVLS